MKRLMMALCLGLIASSAHAVIVLNPANGHYYEAVSGTISWEAAKNSIAGKQHYGSQGYLATLTSLAENDWVWNNVMTTARPAWYLLGGSLVPSSNGTQSYQWTWLNGEAWSFTNWSSGEPNGYPRENALQFWNNGKWNDLIGNGSTTNYGSQIYYAGYIAEYDPAPVPEPMTMTLMGLGLAGAGLFRRYGMKVS